MVSLCEDLQTEFLDLLQAHNPGNEEYRDDLLHIRREVPTNETSEAKEERLGAEQRVKLVVLKHGERIGRAATRFFISNTVPNLKGDPKYSEKGTKRGPDFEQKANLP